jgi:hypothetical protein
VTDNRKMNKPPQPQPVVRLLSVRLGPVTGYFPVAITGPSNTSGEAIDDLLSGSVWSDCGLDDNVKCVVAEVRAFCKMGILQDAWWLRLGVAFHSCGDREFSPPLWECRGQCNR